METIIVWGLIAFVVGSIISALSDKGKWDFVSKDKEQDKK